MATVAPVALVAGVGPGLGAALCRRLAQAGYTVAGLARGARQAQCLMPEAIAETYLQLIRQDRCAWTHELDLRPDVETF